MSRCSIFVFAFQLANASEYTLSLSVLGSTDLLASASSDRLGPVTSIERITLHRTAVDLLVLHLTLPLPFLLVHGGGEARLFQGAGDTLGKCDMFADCMFFQYATRDLGVLRYALSSISRNFTEFELGPPLLRI